MTGEIRRGLARMVPWIAPFYLLTVASLNGLLSFDWTVPGAAVLNQNTWLPLYNYYIVSKPQAAKNIADHIVMYAPVGIMIWLRFRNGEAGVAFVLAALLSLIVEVGRFFRPGLAPDINAIPLAGFAAWAAVGLMELPWRLLSSAAIGLAAPVALHPEEKTINAPVLGWRERAAGRQSRRRDRSEVIGDVEDY